jgi:hypothetical protein
MEKRPINRYNKSLDQTPIPGKGLNCHTSLLGTANLGILAGVPPETIFEDIRGHIPPGPRKVLDREIKDAIFRALADRGAGTFTPKPRPQPVASDSKAALQRIIESSESAEADLWESSPIRLLDEPKNDPGLFLRTLFHENDFIFIGERHDPGILGDTIRTAKEWCAYFENGGQTKPFIIINPLNGLPAPKESGDGETYRGNGNIVVYRHCLGEFDNLPRGDQLRFWSAVKLPIVALVDSGAKSIHALLDVQALVKVETAEQWQTHIKGRLYDRLLTPMGVDGACSNSARLSRLPGHFREEKGNYQRLLWLSPSGRPVC